MEKISYLLKAKFKDHKQISQKRTLKKDGMTDHIWREKSTHYSWVKFR